VLTLDDDFIIEADQYNFHLQRWVHPDPTHHKTKSDAKPRLTHVAYCGSLSSALRAYAKARIRLSLKEDVSAEALSRRLGVVLDAVEQITARLETEFKDEARKAADSGKRRGRKKKEPS